MYLDIDRFKLVNDTLGHDFGDQFLTQVTDRLKTCMGSDDIFARLGGDEFGLLFTSLTSHDDCTRMAARIQESFIPPFDVSGHVFPMIASLGIALHPTDGCDSESLMKNAYTALYRAKDHGRNQFQFYRSEMNTSCLKSFTIQSDLPNAIENSQFVMHYQPRIDPVTRSDASRDG